MTKDPATETREDIPPAKSVPNKTRLLGRILRSLLYVLYLGIVLEAGARLILWPGRVVERVVGLDDSTRRILWVKHHVHGQQKFDYAYETYDSLRGWAMTPNVRNVSVTDGTILNSNSRGIRGTTEYAELRPLGKKRIVVLGDSFTFGNEVADDETYAHYLEGLLPDTEVLNLGVTGYGHDQMLLYLQQEGVKYRPDVVLLGFVWIDMHRNVQEFLFCSKPRFVLRNGKTVLTNVPVPRPEEVLRQEIYRSKLLDLTEILWHKFNLRFGSEQEQARELTAAIFDEMVATCHRIGATPVFAYLPITDELSDTQEAMSANEQFLSQYCQSRQVLCVFLRPEFLAARRRGVDLYNKGHWRPYENLIAAHALKDFLVEKDLVSAPAQNGEVASSTQSLVNSLKRCALRTFSSNEVKWRPLFCFYGSH